MPTSEGFARARPAQRVGERGEHWIERRRQHEERVEQRAVVGRVAEAREERRA